MSSDVFVRSLNRAWVGVSARLELFADEAPPGAPRRSVMGRTILRAIVAPRTPKKQSLISRVGGTRGSDYICNTLSLTPLKATEMSY